MTWSDENRAYLELHFAVLLFGLTAILGDLIQLSALVLVWWRVFLTSTSLAPLARPLQLWRELPRPILWRFVGIGILVGLHWITFFGAIKLANASVALVCMATASFFTALIEPVIVKRPFRWYELLLGILIIPGMMLVVQNLETAMLQGVWVGLLSAFLVAIFATLNKKYIGDLDPIRITFLELSSAVAFLSLVIGVLWWRGEHFGPLVPPQWTDWLFLAILAFCCTSFAYVLSLRSLRHISAFAANLTINMEPVYGIVLAWILLRENEELNPGFYWGVVIIILSVLSYPLLQGRLRRR